MRSIRLCATALAALSLTYALVACGSDDATPAPATTDASTTPAPTADSAAVDPDPIDDDSAAPPEDGGTDGADAADAGKKLADGLLEPVPYTSRADSPLQGVLLATYDHFEDWEDGLVNTPGVTPSSTQIGSQFGAALIDSVDGDDGVVDGKCAKAAGTCNSGFAGGTIDFTFDAAVLGALPTHVGIAWTDGSTTCDAIFEAFDGNDVSLGTKTAAAVGDNSNNGTVAEDRYFVAVHAAGIKKIVVKSSAGGVEVDHLHYGR